MTKEDEQMWNTLKVFLREGQFKMEGKAVPAFLSVFKWVEDLPSKFQKSLPEPKDPELKIAASKTTRKKKK